MGESMSPGMYNPEKTQMIGSHKSLRERRDARKDKMLKQAFAYAEEYLAKNQDDLRKMCIRQIEDDIKKGKDIKITESTILEKIESKRQHLIDEKFQKLMDEEYSV